jgi:hypothetical protein
VIEVRIAAGGNVVPEGEHRVSEKRHAQTRYPPRRGSSRVRMR